MFAKRTKRKGLFPAFTQALVFASSAAQWRSGRTHWTMAVRPSRSLSALRRKALDVGAMPTNLAHATDDVIKAARRANIAIQ